MTSTASSGRIALCVPAYNASSYLPRLFASVAQQTRPFDEVWVYDDCSSDDTSEVAARLGAKVVRGERNLGCSHGKNVLAAQTNCEWIHFHDADDALFPGFVEAAHDWIAADAKDVVLFAYEERDDRTGEFVSVRRFEPEDVARDAISYSIREQINPFCGLYRRSAFLSAGGYDTDPDVLYNEDVAMHCRLARAGLRFAADPRVLVINYRRDNSMSSSNQVKCVVAHYHVMRKAAETLPDRYSREIAARLWSTAGLLARHQQWEAADEAVALAVRTGGRLPRVGGLVFCALCAVNPYWAIRIRERLLRHRWQGG